MTLTQLVATNIRRLMEGQGLSQTELGKRCGMSPHQLHRYVAGKTVPSLDIVERIAGALGVEPWELLIDKNKRTAMNFWDAVQRVRGVLASLERREIVQEVFDLRDVLAKLPLEYEKSPAQLSPPKQRRKDTVE